MANIELNEAALERVEGLLGIQFEDRSLLARAFVHRSFVNEVDLDDADSNERLEFLGDAALGLVVAEILYRRYPDHSEGELTPARASIVSLTALADMGMSLELGEFIQLGRGEDLSGGRSRTSVVGRTFEALLGAIYLDCGLEAVRLVLAPIVDPQLERYEWTGSAKDHKSQLQEHLQAERGITPVYEIVSEQGPDHAKTFAISVLAGDAVLASGEGSSKQRAEQAAARAALAAFPQLKG
jgi:ribonuclease-3